MRKKRKKTLLIIVVCIIFFLAIFAYHKGPWRGKVINAETKQPIEGAAVVAIWEKSVAGPAGREPFFLDAVETKTDKNGEFIIPWKWFIDIPLFRMVGGPYFTIYKPGYGDFPGMQVSPWPPFTVNPNPDYQSKLFRGKGAVVELPELKTKKDRERAFAEAEGWVPLKKTPELMKLINSELKNLGYKPVTQ